MDFGPGLLEDQRPEVVFFGDLLEGRSTSDPGNPVVNSYEPDLAAVEPSGDIDVL